MFPVKQSTALDVLFFAHDVNGDAVAGKLDVDFTKRISKNGAAFAAMTVTITERENGWYHLQISTAHSDTLGILSLTFTAAGIKQVNLQYRVHARILDDLMPTSHINATGGKVDGVALVDTTTANTDMRGTDSAFLAASAPTNFGDLSITATTGLVNITQAAADKVWATTTRTLTALGNTLVDEIWNRATSALTTAGSIGKLLVDNVNATISSRMATTHIGATAGKVDGVALVDTTTANTDMRGTNSALLASAAPTNFGDLAITVTTGKVTAGTVDDKTGYGLADGAITAVKIADGALVAAKMAASLGNKIADMVLRRGFAAAAGSSDGDTNSFRSLLGAVAKLVNKVSITSSTLTVTEADDLTTLGQQAVTTDAAAEPITAVDTT